jgi:hypothetical protein
MLFISNILPNKFMFTKLNIYIFAFNALKKKGGYSPPLSDPWLHAFIQMIQPYTSAQMH